MSEAQRAYVYRILLAAAAVAIFYGLVTDEEAARWIALAVAALGGNGLATLNTSRKPPAD